METRYSKEFKKQMEPDWAEAYVDYDGLKHILLEILHYKQVKQPETPLRSLRKKLSLHRTLNGLHPHPSNTMNIGDVEDQVIDVNGSQKDDYGQSCKKDFLGQSGEVREIEVEFFRKLDEELNRVNNFYKEKIEAVMDEAEVLNKQMDALIALRIKVQSSGGNGAGSDSRAEVEMSGKRGLQVSFNSHSGDSSDSRYEPLTLKELLSLNLKSYSECAGTENTDLIQGTNQEGKSTIEPEFDPSKNIQQMNGPNSSPEVDNGSANQQDPFEILGRVKIHNTLETPLSTIKGVFKDSKDEELDFEKDELRKAEKRLRAVFIEFYQKLRLLKQYSFMNLSALSKIFQTYENISSGKAARAYMEKVDNSDIGSSDELNNLLENVETTFIKHFSNSNIKEGLKLLRPKTKKERHRVTFFSGFFSGFSIALFIAVILRIASQKVMDKQGPSYMVNIFPLYSVFAYIVLHMLVYAADIYFWRCYRINYPYVFGFKQGTELSYREVFLLGTGLAVLTLGSFLANLHLDLSSKTRTHKTLAELFPLGLVAIVLVILFCPFDIIYRSTRFFFMKPLFHCLCAPLYKVTLPDFLLADNLTSQFQTIRSLNLYICYYGLGEFSRRQNKCHGHGVYNVLYFTTAIIPFWIRILQCLRRLFEEKNAMQGWTILNYLLTVVAVLVRTASELKKGMTWMVLAFVCSAVTTITSIYFDIVLDWGLLRRHSKNAYLRDKLLVPHKIVYYAAMLLDIVLRVSWTQSVLEFKLPAFQKVAITTLISCLEIIRRGIGNFFRIENEHLNNVGKYRGFKSVPLPFNYDGEDSDKGD